MILVAGHVPVKPEKRDAMRQAVQQVVARTRAESGCIAYDFYESVSEPHLLHIYEEWESAEALAAHLQQPHTRDFLAKLPELAAGPATVKKFVIASEEVLL